MDGYEYEHRCAAYLKKTGYMNVTVTQASSDQGIDIIAMKDKEIYGIQCKYYEGSVGNKAVQEAFAGSRFYDCTKAMVITNSTFTKSAVELAQKLGVILKGGVDAVVLQNASQSSHTAASPGEARQAKLEQIEWMLAEKYRVLDAKYPNDPIKDANIEAYIQLVKSHIRSCRSSSQSSIDFAVSQMNSKMCWEDIKSLRDSRLTPYKDKIRSAVKSAGAKIESVLEDIDRYASEQVSAGISEQSATKLIDLITSMQYSDGKFTARVECQTIAKTDWSAKHKKIFDKWKALRRELPSAIKKRDRKDEDKETRLSREAVENTRAQIDQVTEEIEQLQTNIPLRKHHLDLAKKELKKIRSDRDSMQRKINQNQRLQAEECGPMEQQLSDQDAQHKKLTEQNNALYEELRSVPFFFFQRKKELKEKCNSVQSEILILSAQRSQLNEQLHSATAKHRQNIENLQNEYDGLTQAMEQQQKKISKIALDIQKGISKKELAQKQKELEALQKTLSELEKSLRSAHENYLLWRYSDSICL